MGRRGGHRPTGRRGRAPLIPLRSARTWPLTFVAILASGCAIPAPTFDWTREPGHRPLAKTLRIERFEDSRPSLFTNTKGAAWLPFVPFGTTIYHRPGARLGAADPAGDFPRALAGELAKARIFEQVSLADSTDGGGAGVGADLILDGEIRAARVEMRFITWCLSFGALPLWIVGVPMRRIRLVLDVQMRITDAKTGEVLWLADLEDDLTQWQGMYYGRDYFHFPKLMARGAIRTALALDGATGRGDFGGGG